MAYEDLYNSDNSTTDDLVNNPWVNNFATRGMLSGVQYLAETLGKPARALFGTLAGKPEELLNLLPLSDTLGITDPNQAVGGRDLLREYGLVGPEDNWGNFLGGLALDVAADPLGFVKGPLGALTKIGEAAAKSGKGLGRSVAKRIAADQGGLFQIMDKPWYAEMIGMGKQNPVYTAGIDPFLKPQMEAAAKGLESGWSKATRATVPGTQFSPLAWMRSAFEPGAANVTGHPVLVDTFGDVNQATYKELAGDAADAIGKSDIYGIQADYLNRLADTGLDNAQAAQLLHRAATSRRELGELKYIQDWATPDQFALAKEFADKVDPLVGRITDPVRGKALDVGYDVGDTTAQGWKFSYLPRAKSESGNRMATHAMARNEDLALLPGGGAMAEAIMMDDLFSGINKSSALKTQGIDPDVFIQQGIQKWAPTIKSEAIDRLQKMYPPTATDVPEALKALATDEGAAELASRVIRQAADLPLDMAVKGQFYRPDIATELLDYTKNMSKLTAPRASAIETLAREAGDYQKMISVKPTTEGTHTLVEALREIKIPGAKEKLAQRLNIPEDDLVKFGVNDDLVKALTAEVNPAPPTAKSGWAKAVDAFRYGVTIPWPANLVRNWTSTMMDQGVSGTGATNGLLSAQDFLRGNLTPEKHGLAAIRKWEATYQKAIEHGVVNTDQVHALLGEGFDRIGNAAVNVKPAQPGKTVIQSLKDWARPIVSEEAGKDIGVKPFRELFSDAGSYKSTAASPVKAAAETVKPASNVSPTAKSSPVKEMAEDYSGLSPVLKKGENLKSFIEESMSDFDKIYREKYPELYKDGPKSIAKPGSKLKSELDAAFAESEARMAAEDAMQSVSPPSVARPDTQSVLSGSNSAKQWMLNQIGKAVDPVRRYMGTMEQAHHFQNEATRLQQFANLLDEGYSARAAGQRVKINQRDFLEGSTPFVQKQLRNFIPFANFCMPPDHEILTRDGWKNYADLTIGEEVMSYDINSEELHWVPLLAINVFDYSGEMLSIKRKGSFEFKFTPEHMWPTKTDEMVVKRSYATYIYPERKSFVRGTDLRGYHKIPTAGNFVGPTESILSPRLAAILGWVVTDGYFRWRGKHCEMVVYQHPKKFLKEIIELLGTAPRKPHPDTGVVCVPVCAEDSKQISFALRDDVDLVKCISRLSRESAESMWNAMFMAEGTVNPKNGRQQFSQNPSVNKDILDAFQLLCLMTGRNMAVRGNGEVKFYKHSIDGRDVESRDGTSHYIKTRKWLYVRGNPSIHKEAYTGKVWCPTTSLGTWLVRRNGHVVITGNSVQNIRSQADMLSRQPGRYSTLMNILNSGRDSGGFVPGYASSGASIELPGAEPGQKRFLSSLGLTQEDEMMSGIASLLALRPEEGVRKIVSGMNPALKVPFEMATGTQVFSGRRLDDLKPSTAATVATLGMNPSAARFLSEMASGTPMARVFSTVDRVADYEKRGVGNLLLNLMTGTRTVDVDQEMASQIAARDTITKLLNASDQYKLREQLVVEPKWKGREEEMPESIRQMWVQYQMLQQAAKKAVQERQAAAQR